MDARFPMVWDGFFYPLHPGKLTAGTQGHGGGLVQMIFLFREF